MRRAALLRPCARALQQQVGAEGQLAERLMSSSLAGPSQASQTASSLYNSLRHDPSAVQSFVRAYSVLAGRSVAVGNGSGAGLSGIARQHAGLAAAQSFRQVRLLCRFTLARPLSPASVALPLLRAVTVEWSCYPSQLLLESITVLHKHVSAMTSRARAPLCSADET